jgi:hypothetical protein
MQGAARPHPWKLSLGFDRSYDAIYQIWGSRPQNHLITEGGEEVRRASRVTSTGVAFLSRLEESRGFGFDWLLHQ